MSEEAAAAGRTVVSKAAAILMTFLDDGCVHSLTEIAAATGLPLSTAHRLARELVAWRILDRTEDGDYRVGLPLRLIGSAGACGSSIEERAPLILQDMSYATGAEVRLGILRDRAVAYIEKLPGRRPVSAFSTGAVLPAHATAMGKALLAFSPPEFVEIVVSGGLTAYTRYTITAPDRFRRALAMTRLSRLAVSRWELRMDHSALAVPVFGPGGQVAAALEVRVEDPAAELPTIRPALMIAGRSLTRELAGGRGFRAREPGPAYASARPPGTSADSVPSTAS
ncbi:IclR family transcriptional regulator [Pseudonocardia acidicola]|uniref:IclR family transcriptional regulator n=1 Tax=Pseudonocardia acidicola TaxID=2724939 RepID=A0ABX1SA74_9PSEU|nr:IclR family transcriptional regulator [Pseudonocardia acidicola]NMH97717.1 IclR family transcriptional regulator [Pseudonocardia acidicola]